MSNNAEIEITASTRRLPSALRSALKMVQGFAHATLGILDPRKHKDPDHGSLALGSAIGGVASQLAMRGLDKMISLGHEVFDFNDKLTRFGIAARIGGTELLGVGAAIRQVSGDTGVNATEVLRGARAYVDLAGAAAYTTEKMSLIARASQASGSDINDMATVVYALQHSLSIPNTELEDTIGGLINLSKDGAVHFNQMAQELIGLAPVYAQFGIKGRQGAIELASQLEVVRTGFGTASEAGTGLLRLYRSIPQHAKLFEKAGVQIFKPGSRTDLLTLGQILRNIKGSALEKDRPALIKAFGRGEAERSYQLLDKLLNEYQALEEAGRRNGVVQEDLATYTTSAAGRMNIAVERMKNAFAEALTPERVDQIVTGIERIAQAMPAVMEAIGRVSDAFAGFIAMTRHGADWVSGLKDYKYTKGEEQLLQAPDEAEAAGISMSPNTAKAILDLKKKKQAYEQQMEELVASESPTGASDVSVEKAVRARNQRGDLTAGQLGAQEAGRAYLQDRYVTDSAILRARDRVDAQEKAATSEAVAKNLADAVREAMKDGFRSLFSSDLFRGPMQVSFDANSGGRAIRNAPDQRRK